MIEVRKATPADAGKLLPMVQAYWRHDGLSGFDSGSVTSQLERLLSDSRLGDGWMALSGGTPVGYLLAVYVFSLEHLGLTAEIDELFVLPEARGNGAGARLLERAEAQFARIGCTNVSLQLSRDSEAARRFYQRHGFGERSGFELLDKSLRSPNSG